MPCNSVILSDTGKSPMTNASPQRPSRLRTLIVLGRVSNLPTVWSNCLAGWLLTGTPVTPSLALLLGSASCLYTGGMFLNDAHDAGFDRVHRPERPIPRGLISTRAVYSLALLFLAAGILLLMSLGPDCIGVGLLLVGCILAYTWLHKGWTGALLLMAGARVLLYWLAATAATESPNVWLPSAGLGAYVLGISAAARFPRPSPLGNGALHGLLLVPVPLALALATQSALAFPAAAAALLLVWVVGTLRCGTIDKRVPRLLAGIPLVDLLFVSTSTPSGWSFPIFGVLLASALLVQKRVPAD